MLGALERAEIGHITQWARTARELYALYCAEVERHPNAVITVTMRAE